MKFKVGDKVRCVNPDFGLSLGTIYNVIQSKSANTKTGDSDAVILAEHPDRWFYSERFELANTLLTLPTDSTQRKEFPLFRGLLRYFPAALAGVARTSKLGNDKHNPGEEMHHARSKSSDHGDCIMRHLVDVEDLLAALKRGNSKVTAQDVINEVNQMAWRALAFSQQLHENFGAPLAPGAKLTADTAKETK